MSGRKFQTFCKITDYLEEADPEILELLRGTCSEGSILSLKGKAGITFLIPQDKAMRKKLSDLAYSAKYEEVDKANDILNSLIFRDVFKTPSDWMAKRDDIPNALHPAQHVEVESASGKEIVFKSGARAVVDEAFMKACRRDNLAVWKLISGELPVTKDKPATLKYSRKKHAKTGGYSASESVTQEERWAIAVAVENMYMLERLQRQIAPAQGNRIDAFSYYTLSLISFLLGRDRDLVVDCILPQYTQDKLSFYLILEPHGKSGSDYLVSNDLISEWWGMFQSRGNSVLDCAAVSAEIRRVREESQSNAAIYANYARLQRAIQDTRVELINNTANPRRSAELICDVYTKLEQTNNLGEVAGVFPARLAQHYASAPGLKMLHDVLRYQTYHMFEMLERDRTFDRGQFSEITNFIGDCLYAADPESRQRAGTLLNKDLLRVLINPAEKIQEIKYFVSSTVFLFTPVSDLGSLKTSTSRPDPNSRVIYDIQGRLAERHARLLGSANGSDKALIDAINRLGSTELSSELVAALAALNSRLGQN